MNEHRTAYFQSCFGVFQGGGCRGAAFAGAVEHAFARGVNFAGVAGTSAGSIVAALLAAGADGTRLSQIVSTLKFQDLLQPPDATKTELSFWGKAGLKAIDSVYPGASTTLRNNGRYSSSGIEAWLNKELKKLLPDVRRATIKFSDLVIPIWIVASDLKIRDTKIWSLEGTPDEDVAKAVRCSCSIPGFFQAVEGQYVDGGLLSNLPSFAFSAGASRVYARNILAFTLSSEKSQEASQLRSPKDYFTAIVNTAIDGATNLQSRMIENVSEVRISTGSIESTDFEGMDADKVRWLKDEGWKAAKNFFDSEAKQVSRSETRRSIYSGDDEILSEITTLVNTRKIKGVTVCGKETKWVYSIFPAFLKWCAEGVTVRAVLGPSVPADKHEDYRRRLLKELGVSISVSDDLPFRGFLFDPEDENGSAAVIYAEESFGNEPLAMRYSGPNDHPAIRALAKAVGSQASHITPIPPPKLVRTSDIELIRRLKAYVPDYANASMKMETLPLSNLLALSKLVREYKYQQVKALYAMFKTAGLDAFEPAVVAYASGLETIVTPPVVEAVGGDFVLIQGTTRATLLHREGVEEMRCLVVSNPGSPPPAKGRTRVKHILVGGKTLSTEDRYNQKITDGFRSIEQAVHQPAITLVRASL